MVTLHHVDCCPVSNPHTCEQRNFENNFVCPDDVRPHQCLQVTRTRELVSADTLLGRTLETAPGRHSEDFARGQRFAKEMSKFTNNFHPVLNSRIMGGSFRHDRKRIYLENDNVHVISRGFAAGDRREESFAVNSTPTLGNPCLHSSGHQVSVKTRCLAQQA